MSDMIAATRPKSDQLNSDDLIGGPRVITIERVVIKDSAEQPISVFYGDNGKPWKPCKSMARVMMEVWKSPDSKTYTGRSLKIYRDPEAVFGGAKVGGIRISEMSHIDSAMTVMLTVSRGHKKPFIVRPLQATQAQAPATPPDKAVVDAGNLAAMEGVATYTAWLATLTPEVKATVRHLHKGWSDAAKMADAPAPETVSDVLDALPTE